MHLGYMDMLMISALRSTLSEIGSIYLSAWSFCHISRWIIHGSLSPTSKLNRCIPDTGPSAALLQ